MNVPLKLLLLKKRSNRNFVREITNMVSYSSMNFLKISSSEFALILSTSNNGRHKTFDFQKDVHDDFWKIYSTNLGGPIFFDWDNADTHTGSWSTSGTNWYASSVGATFTCHVKGNCVKFKHYLDNRGGVWRFTIDGGSSVDISTWSSSANSLLDTIVASGLDETIDHTVVGTFIGDDPTHAPSGGVGTSRGWVRYNASDPTDSSIQGFFNDVNGNSETVTGGSNMELALQITHGGETKFVPEHENTGTTFAAESMVININGSPINFSSMTNYTLINCTSFSLTQHMNIHFPLTPTNNFAELWMTHSIDTSGSCTYIGRFKALDALTINVGYPTMLSLKNGVLEECVTSFRNSRINDKSDVIYNFIDESEYCYSVCGVDQTRSNYVAAFEVLDVGRTLRQGYGGKPLYPLFALQSSAYYLKVYNQVFSNYTMQAGEEYNWSGRCTAAYIPGAYQLFK